MTWKEIKRQFKEAKIPDTAIVKVGVDFRGGPVRLMRAYKDEKGKKIVAVVLEN